MTNWIYERTTGRYRVTKEGAADTGQRPGTFVSQTRRVELRDLWAESQRKVTDRLAADFHSGKISLSEWTNAMRTENRINYVEQYLLGHGGRNNMTPADWGRVGNAIREQNELLQKYANDLLTKQPPLSLAQMQARSRLYVNGSTAMYERGNALARGMPDLPQYPGDGSQICRSNCKCHWDIKDTPEAWLCTWVLDPGAIHCSTCVDNSAMWSPLVVRKR